MKPSEWTNHIVEVLTNSKPLIEVLRIFKLLKPVIDLLQIIRFLMPVFKWIIKTSIPLLKRVIEKLNRQYYIIGIDLFAWQLKLQTSGKKEKWDRRIDKFDRGYNTVALLMSGITFIMACYWMFCELLFKHFSLSSHDMPIFFLVYSLVFYLFSNPHRRKVNGYVNHY